MNALQKLTNNENDFTIELEARAAMIRAEIAENRRRPWRLAKVRRLRNELRTIRENLANNRARYWMMREEVRRQLWHA